jgi:hexosaminidase
MTITLKYQLHCDKTDLKKEIFEPLAVSEYINETVADYNKALTMAKEIYFDETSGQLAVNNALRALQDAKNKAVKLEYYSLYVEVTYPLNESDYSSGYQAYKNAVTTGKTLLNSEGLTVEKAKEAYNAIQTAKQSLVKPNAKVPTISATDTYYQSNNYNNMIDGNINTKCWFNSNQEIGKEVKFTFTRPINISSIQIIQPRNAGGDIIDGADVQISTDGKNWTTVGTLDNSAFEKTITFDKTLTKYVRIVLTEGKGNWYQIAEVKFELEEIPEDSTLKDMILEAETLNITGKSSGSVNEMIDALIVAQKSYVEGKVDVTEETNNLRNAINALRDTVTSNKEKLTNKINDAKEIENNNYSIESWSRFEKALLEAIIVNEDSNATQEQVDKAYDDLDKAIKGLIDAPVIVDKKELSNVIETTNDFVEKDYTVDSWKAFKEALDHAKDVLQNENTTQDEVDQALASLQDAIKNLKTVSQTGNNDQPNQKPNDQIQTSIKKEDDNKTSSTKNNSHIKTGDDMSVVPYILLMATAGGYIALQRRNKED